MLRSCVRLVGVWMVGVWLACASVATAQSSTDSNDEVARNLFQAGKVAFDAGDYEGALQFFEQSYARSQRPGLLYNIGQAADRLRQDDKALTSFRGYLQALPNADNRAEVENRIGALERLRSTDASTTATEPAPAAQPTPPVESAPTSSPVAPTPDVSPAAVRTTRMSPQTARRVRPWDWEEPPPTAPANAQQDNGGGSLWWLWTGIGVVVVGGVVTAIALSSGGTTVEPPLAGNTNVTVTALGGAR